MLELPGVCVEVRPMVVDYSQFELRRAGRAAAGAVRPAGDAAEPGLRRLRTRRRCGAVSRGGGPGGLAPRRFPPNRQAGYAGGAAQRAGRPATPVQALGIAGRRSPTAADPPEESFGSSTDDRLARSSPAATRPLRSRPGSRSPAGRHWPHHRAGGACLLVNETTLAQRIVRAKRKITASGIALECRPRSGWPIAWVTSGP